MTATTELKHMEALTEIDGTSTAIGTLMGGGGAGALVLMWRWLLGHARASQQDLNALMLERIRTLERRDEERQKALEEALTARADMERAHGEQMLRMSDEIGRLKDVIGAQAERIVELETSLTRANAKIAQLRAERREIGLADSESWEE